MLHECFSLIVASPAPLQGFNSAACTIELFPFFAPSFFPRIDARWTRIPYTCVPNTVRYKQELRPVILVLSQDLLLYGKTGISFSICLVARLVRSCPLCTKMSPERPCHRTSTRTSSALAFDVQACGHKRAYLFSATMR